MILNFKCTTQSCANKNTVKVSTLVTFVDVSQPPHYTQSQVRKPNPTLPGDFFYPFGASRASNTNHSSYLIYLNQILFILAVLRF